MTKAEMQARIDALEAKLVIARTLYKELRDSVKLVTSPVLAPEAKVVVPVVTCFHDALGRKWVKTRLGSRAVSRLASAQG